MGPNRSRCRGTTTAMTCSPISARALCIPRTILLPWLSRLRKRRTGDRRFAQRTDLPIYPVGGGTVLSDWIHTRGNPISGIIFDFHRMQGIEVDRDRLVVRAQPGATGLQVSQLVQGCYFGYRPYFGGSPGALPFCSLHGIHRPEQNGRYQDGWGSTVSPGWRWSFQTARS